MKYRLTYLLVSMMFYSAFCFSQKNYTTVLQKSNNENWWGGVVAYGSQMPYIKPVAEFNLALQHGNNQVVPLFLSDKGRFIWSDKPFRFEVKEDFIEIHSEYEQIEVQQAGTTLREAYLSASSKNFPPSGVLPETLFFTMPQYNTWIELMYNQNQNDILDYAQNIVASGLPEGVLMIDDNWQKYYGNFEFKAEKFSDPKAMVEKLHNMGFKIMLWVCPFVSADTPEYRELEEKNFLIKAKGENRPAIIKWWNGQSACYDLTNPQARDHYIAQLKKLQSEYGIDGFKFDAGDNSFYDPKKIDSYQKDAISTDHVLAWQKIGLQFPFNEYRAGWQMGGQALVERLGDKRYSWDAVQALIPEMLAAGLLGYPYTCPDMIGGGSFADFLNIKSDEFDQTLIVRSAQIHALMPMMQFSVAPWRVLSKENLDIVVKMGKLHQSFGDYILQYAKIASQTGEPIVRHMEYSFPGQGFAQCTDQFMLGEKYMVAPIITAENIREVKLPKGKWKDDAGKSYKGGKTYTIEVPLSRLLYFEKVK